MDYFAVFLPDFLVFDEDLQRRNQIHCRYLTALGHLGRGSSQLARAEFGALLDLIAAHEGAHPHMRLLESGLN